MDDLLEKFTQAVAKCVDQCKSNPDSLKATHFSQSAVNLVNGMDKALEVKIKMTELELKEAELATRKAAVESSPKKAG